MSDQASRSASAPSLARQRLAVVLAVGSAITLAEVVSGLLANSLVLLADAAHFFTDLLALGVALIAATWATRPADPQHSFGHGRSEVIAAFVNAVVLWGVVGLLVVEAYLRLRSPSPVQAPILVVVGSLTLVASLALAAYLRSSQGASINLRAAYLHLLSDGLGSTAAVVAGLLIYFGGYQLADPIATLVVSGLIAAFALRLSRETVDILLEGTPSHLNPAEVEGSIRKIPSVQSVHDLHLWTLGSGSESMSVHVVLESSPSDDSVIHSIQALVRERFLIRHATVQVEAPDCPCGVAAH